MATGFHRSEFPEGIMPIRTFRSSSVGFIIVLLLIASPRASAGPGVSLSWNTCFGEGTGVRNVNFACNTNAGTRTLVGSITSGIDIDRAYAFESQIDIAAAAADLPAWWMVQIGGCRYGGLSSDGVASATDVACVDIALGQGVVPHSYSVGDRGPNTLRLHVGLGFDNLAGTFIPDVTAGVEYFIFNVRLGNSKTTGDGACGGCSTPVCIVFNSTDVLYCDPLATPECFGPNTNYPRHFISGAAAPGSDFVTWQGGGLPTVGGATGCPAATATKARTWGSVKALYR
jgi:hypothetical protein